MSHTPAISKRTAQNYAANEYELVLLPVRCAAPEIVPGEIGQAFVERAL